MNVSATWATACVLAAFAGAPLQEKPEAAADGSVAQVQALAERQAANLALIRNGRCKGDIKRWMDIAALRNTGGTEVQETHAVCSMIEFIGPPGGPLRVDSVAEPVRVNGQERPDLMADRFQLHWDGKRLLRYYPTQQLAQIEPVDGRTWATAHPLFYGLTFQGKPLDAALEGQADATYRFRRREEDGLFEVELGHGLPAGARVRMVAAMDPGKGMFVTGYRILASVPGLEGERLQQEVSIKPVEVQAGTWFPAEVTETIYRIDSRKPVSRMNLTFSDVELNVPDLQPGHLQFDLPPDTRVGDMTAPPGTPSAE
jgi:hypothetical protein